MLFSLETLRVARVSEYTTCLWICFFPPLGQGASGPRSIISSSRPFLHVGMLLPSTLYMVGWVEGDFVVRIRGQYCRTLEGTEGCRQMHIVGGGADQTVSMMISYPSAGSL